MLQSSPSSPVVAHALTIIRAAGATGAVNPAPPLSRPPAATGDVLSPLQRRVLIAGILVAHGSASWGLLQLREVREAVALAAPIFVNLVTPPAPPLPAPPPPTPLQIKPITKALPPPAPLVTAAPTPAPAAFIAAAPLPDPAPPVPVALAAPTEPPAPASPAPALPAPAPAPTLIPASAVQYLEPPTPEYPRTSRRLGEAGRVQLRVYIDEAGVPRQVLVAQSSGFARLDDAALAAMKRARFKPYSENGQATAGWAVAPIDFELEK